MAKPTDPAVADPDEAALKAVVLAILAGAAGLLITPQPGGAWLVTVKVPEGIDLSSLL